MSRILITGAGQRLGRAMAEGLASDGHALCLHYNRSAAEVEALVNSIRGRGGEAVAVHAELSDAAAAAALFAQAREVFGPVDTLINNASIYEEDRLSDFTAESWARNLDINLRAPALLVQAFLHQLPENGRGSIVNFLDARVAAPLGGDFLSYTVSKCGLKALTQMLAVELAPRVCVNAVAPGLTLPSNGQTQAEFQAAQAATPLKHGPEAADILRALRYLLAAGPVTGQILYVDGGERFLARPLDCEERE